MLYVSVTGEDGQRQTFELYKTEITIGRVEGNDIVLPSGRVSKRHTRLVLKDGRLVIVDLKSTNGTLVNGQRINSPLVVRESDTVDIGGFTLEFSLEDRDDNDADTGEVDATELRLLAAVVRRDETSRLVYADWLEEHGYPDRAEFLRIGEELIGMSPQTPEFRTRSRRMSELATTIDIKWRYKVARPLVQNCLAVEFACPKDWGSLDPTERGDVRLCGTCAKRVYYCTTVPEAQLRARRGDCVAIDLGNAVVGIDTFAPAMGRMVSR